MRVFVFLVEKGDVPAYVEHHGGLGEFRRRLVAWMSTGMLTVLPRPWLGWIRLHVFRHDEKLWKPE